MPHVLFEHKRANAQHKLTQLETQLADVRQKMRHAFLADQLPEAQKLQYRLTQLEKEHRLATAWLETIESTRKAAEEETQQAEADLNRLQASLPGDTRKLTRQLEQALEQLQSAAQEMARRIQALEVCRSQRYEMRHLSRLLGRQVELPPPVEVDLENLPAIGHQLSCLARQASSPNVAIRWQAESAELDRVFSQEHKRQRLAEEEQRRAETSVKASEIVEETQAPEPSVTLEPQVV